MDDDQRAEVDQIQIEIRTRTSELVTILEMYDPSLYPPAVLKENKFAWIKEAQDAYKSLITYFIQLEERMPTLTPDEVRDGKEARKKIQEAVSKFVLDVNLKVMSLNDQAPPPSSRNLMDNDSDDSSAAEDQAKKAAKAGYDVDREKINEEIKDLFEEINQVEDWSQSLDHEVETTMSKISEWKKQLKSIKDSFYSMKRNVKSKELDNPNDPDDPLKTMEASIANLEDDMKIKVEDLQYEDKSRCLYSLVKSKSADIQYPIFTGSTNEDFFRFQQEMEEAFVSNKVRKEDRCKKLRNCLKFRPLSFVPETMKDIDEAWSTLKQL